MAFIIGTSGSDFIHQAGDGEVPPAGYNEILEVKGGADFINGRGGDDIVFAQGGDDTLDGGNGADVFNGGGGTDTAVLHGDFSDYTVSFTGNDIVLTRGNVEERLTGVEIIAFNDQAVRVVGSGSEYDTVQKGVDAANAGQAVLVAPGEYVEDVVFNKSVTLLGAKAGDAGTAGGRDAAAGGGETTLVGHHDITASGPVTINGVRFVNDGTTTGGGPSDPTLNITTGFGHVITNSIFFSTVAGAANDDRAIMLPPIADGTVTISNNYLTGSATGLYGTASWSRAIWFDGGGVDLVVTGNTIEYARTGLNLDASGSSDIDASGNTFQNVGTGVSGGINIADVVDGIQDNDFQNVGTEFNFRSITSDLVFDAGEAVGTVTPANPFNDLIYIESGSGNDTLFGTKGNDLIDANASNNLTAVDNDVVSGRGGNDFLLGRYGADTLDGGAGADVLFGGDGADVFAISATVDIDGKAERLNGGANKDRLEFVVAGGTVNLSNAVFTSVENIRLNGQTATLTADQLSAFATIEGSAGVDTILLQAPGTVDLKGDAVTGIDNFVGSAGNDSFKFKNVATGQTVSSGAGNDTLHGSLADDTLEGGVGDDTFFVQNAGDLVSEAESSGTDIVHSTVDITKLAANVENLSLSDDSAASVGNGNKLANRIQGNDGANSLDGLEGDDRLLSLLGADTLRGGNGLDQFVFDEIAWSTPAERDIITDLKQGKDRINLRNIDADTTQGGEQDFTFIGTDPFTTGVPGQVRFAVSGGETIVQGDVDGDGVADLEIALIGALDLTKSDFVL